MKRIFTLSVLALPRAIAEFKGQTLVINGVVTPTVNTNNK